MEKNETTGGESPFQLIDARIRELGDWRGETLSHGMICTGETYKSVVKVTFAKGASLPDPARLFNSSLEGNTRRAIDFHENDAIDEDSFKALVRAGAERNSSARR